MTDREPADDPAAPTDDDATDDDATDAAPLADLATAVADRESDASADPAVDDLFDRQDVEELDTDRLWERLEGDDPATPAGGEDEREFREIDPHRYCHDCEFFTDPPDVACTHEGTEILEMPSPGTFRVVDCPVVLEDERLEREY